MARRSSVLKNALWSAYGRMRPGPKEGRYVATNLLEQGRQVADVCIVTNCGFPGGNASSTLTELQAFREAGLSVLIVHCSIKRSPWKWRWLAERYRPFEAAILPADLVQKITCDTLIVRGPRMMMTPLFERLSAKIRTRHAIFVVNNSAWSEQGKPVFSWPALHRLVAAMPWREVELCPLGPIVRAEAERTLARHGIAASLSPRDWPPAFDARRFSFAPRARLEAPIVIGRHARDHPGKWLEDPAELLAVYPSGNPAIRVRVMGGADSVAGPLGGLPEDWEVIPFGTEGVEDYLAGLDVFVYFPAHARDEAFGRTVVEALLSGLPAILPPRFEATFGELALYCEPGEVQGVIGRIAADDAGRLAYLAEAREAAARRYGAKSLPDRLRATPGAAEAPARLGEAARAFRLRAMNGA